MAKRHIINPQRVDEEIGRLDLIFPSGRSNQELRVIANTFYSIFRTAPEEDFIAAVNRHIETGQFFPKPSEIRTHLNDLSRRRQLEASSAPQIEMQPATPAQVRETLKPYYQKIGKRI